MIALIGLFKLSARCNEHSIIPILDSCVFSDITTMTLSIIINGDHDVIQANSSSYTEPNSATIITAGHCTFVRLIVRRSINYPEKIAGQKRVGDFGSPSSKKHLRNKLRKLP